MDAEEVESFAALVEESSRTNESVGKLFNEAARDPAIIFRHDSGCLAQPGVHCNCTFARMNFNEISALDTAAQSGCDGLNTKSILQIRLSARDNQILSNIASFFGVFTGARQGKQASPKPTSALRIMTAGDEEGRVFLGPNGIFSKSFASTRAAVTELRALVARQAAAIPLQIHRAAVASARAPALPRAGPVDRGTEGPSGPAGARGGARLGVGRHRRLANLSSTNGDRGGRAGRRGVHADATCEVMPVCATPDRCCGQFATAARTVRRGDTAARSDTDTTARRRGYSGPDRVQHALRPGAGDRADRAAGRASYRPRTTPVAAEVPGGRAC